MVYESTSLNMNRYQSITSLGSPNGVSVDILGAIRLIQSKRPRILPSEMFRQNHPEHPGKIGGNTGGTLTGIQKTQKHTHTHKNNNENVQEKLARVHRPQNLEGKCRHPG